MCVYLSDTAFAQHVLSLELRRREYLFCKDILDVPFQLLSSKYQSNCRRPLTMQIAKKQPRTTSKYAIAKYTQVFCTSDLSIISPLHSERRLSFFFLIVPVPVYPPQYYWPLLHVSRFLYSLNKTSQARQNLLFQTYVKFLRVLQNPARFALSRDAVSGVFIGLLATSANHGCTCAILCYSPFKAEYCVFSSP